MLKKCSRTYLVGSLAISHFFPLIASHISFHIKNFDFIKFKSFHFIFIPELIPVQHSPPARQTRSQARPQTVLTLTTRAPLDGTPAIPQLGAKLDRGLILEGAAPSRKEGRGPRRSSSFSGVVGRFPGTWRTSFRGPSEDGEEQQEHFVEVEGSDGTEGVPAPVGSSKGTGGPTLPQSNQPVSHQPEPSSLAIMQQMTQIMTNLQAASSSEA
ncbi:hypothetical protein O181_101442 [Austropuccinia psidii MF-1]|uniref:Uncharacterized protein n=1 Tax=Austropuccinia psidii MF-1 TaxID=1389203 RepID=A0A9Q3PIJ0_9BASI|nr:hypothetical protein [Austropuccinia psidii MF-1]